MGDSVHCSLCHGYKGIRDVKLLCLYICVLHMCECSWFQKSTLFYFHSIIHCGKIKYAVHIVGCLPSICSPHHPSLQFLISICESGVPEILTSCLLQCLVIIGSAKKSALLLVQMKKKKSGFFPLIQL